MVKAIRLTKQNTGGKNGQQVVCVASITVTSSSGEAAPAGTTLTGTWSSMPGGRAVQTTRALNGRTVQLRSAPLPAQAGNGCRLTVDQLQTAGGASVLGAGSKRSQNLRW